MLERDEFIDSTDLREVSKCINDLRTFFLVYDNYISVKYRLGGLL